MMLDEASLNQEHFDRAIYPGCSPLTLPATLPEPHSCDEGEKIEITVPVTTECCSCLEYYGIKEEKEDRRPVGLPCGHHMCYDCFKKLHIKRCPMCRFELSQQAPINLGMIELMEKPFQMRLISKDLILKESLKEHQKVASELKLAVSKNKELTAKLSKLEYQSKCDVEVLNGYRREINRVYNSLDERNKNFEKLIHENARLRAIISKKEFALQQHSSAPSHVYSVLIRARSKKLEDLLGEEARMYDTIDTCFESYDLHATKLYFAERAKEINAGPSNEYWRTVSISIVMVKIGDEIDEGKINERYDENNETLPTMYFPPE